MNLLSIILTQQGDEFRAQLDGHPEIWGNGKTLREAIGNLICSHQAHFKLQILLL